MTDAPHNLEAERSVLGAMLVTAGAVRAVLGSSGLEAEHFYLDHHRDAYRAMTYLAARDEPIETLSVEAELRRRRHPPRDGYLSDLASTVPIPGNAAHYAELVLEQAQLRYQREGAMKILEGVEERVPEAVAEGIARASQDLRHASVPVEPHELADEFLAHIEADEPGVCWSLPFARFSNHLGGGLYPGQITGIIGWPSDGKTTLIDQILAHAHGQGARCLILATEMTRLERVARFCSAETSIPWYKIRQAKLTAKERAAVTEVLNRIPFGFREIKGWSGEEVGTEIAMRRPDICAVDSIHGLPYRDAGELRLLSGAFAAAAAKVGCHLLHVYQLNMARAKEAFPPPLERDIRDAGALQYDTDNIVSIYRPRGPSGIRGADAVLSPLKVRNGIAGHTINLQLAQGRYGFEPKRKKPKDEPAPVTDETPIEQMGMTRPVDK
jgi:replicative DNA helicase